MQASPEDRLEYPDKPRRSPVPLLVVVVLILALVYWFLPGDLGDDVLPEPVAPTVPDVPAAPERPVAADIPPAAPPPVVAADPQPAGAAPEAPPAPPPPLAKADSDAELRETLTVADPAGALAPLLVEDHLVDRGAALIDSLSQGLVLRKLLPLRQPPGSFTVREVQGITYVDEAGFARYDAYAGAIAALDTEVLAAAFHRARPLLESAYAELGYPADDLDNALISVLDRVLATPELREPQSLVKVEAVYRYADPELEALSPLQKQLLRMGPKNAATVRAQAGALRAALLGQ